MEELNQPQLEEWNEAISAIFSRQIALAAREDGRPGGGAWLFDPIATGVTGTSEADITWTAFPKRISDGAPTPRAGWQRADGNRDEQEEYCEWEVERDPTLQNRIVRATFTCETEDYYRFLARQAPDLLLRLYRTHVSQQVQTSDLLVDGEYDPQNSWNYPQNGRARGSLMHMAQANNSFEAAVNLTGIASWPRVDQQGNPIIGEQALIACRPFGDSRRHSDPHIGSEINTLVRAGTEVSFADPIGLYIDDVDQSDWETPDGSDPAAWVRLARGTEQHKLRLVFESPNPAHLLGEVRIGGELIEFGSQIAEKLQIRIRGIARRAAAAAPRLRCRAPSLTPGMLASDQNIDQAVTGPSRLPQQ
jgi:hypothetical protein